MSYLRGVPGGNKVDGSNTKVYMESLADTVRVKEYTDGKDVREGGC